MSGGKGIDTNLAIPMVESGSSMDQQTIPCIGEITAVERAEVLKDLSTTNVEPFKKTKSVPLAYVSNEGIFKNLELDNISVAFIYGKYESWSIAVSVSHLTPKIHFAMTQMFDKFNKTLRRYEAPERELVLASPFWLCQVFFVVDLIVCTLSFTKRFEKITLKTLPFPEIGQILSGAEFKSHAKLSCGRVTKSGNIQYNATIFHKLNYTKENYLICSHAVASLLQLVDRFNKVVNTSPENKRTSLFNVDYNTEEDLLEAQNNLTTAEEVERAKLDLAFFQRYMKKSSPSGSKHEKSDEVKQLDLDMSRRKKKNAAAERILSSDDDTGSASSQSGSELEEDVKPHKNRKASSSSKDSRSKTYKPSDKIRKSSKKNEKQESGKRVVSSRRETEKRDSKPHKSSKSKTKVVEEFSESETDDSDVSHDDQTEDSFASETEHDDSVSDIFDALSMHKKSSSKSSDVSSDVSSKKRNKK